MANYVTYKCTVCRRTKDIIRDDVRALPNQCSITKACTGILYKEGEKTIPDIVSPESGVQDWYPRGKKLEVKEASAEDVPVSLSCSSTGTVTLALKLTDAEAAYNQDINVNFVQTTPADIPYQQYLFRPTVDTTLVSGRDSQNKNLRFDQLAIDEKRVYVRVNGVPKVEGVDITLTPNTVTFSSIVAQNSSIEISVYFKKITTERSLSFAANAFNVSAVGAWGNIRWINRFNSSGAPDAAKWRVYTGRVSLAESAKLKLVNITDLNNVEIVQPSSAIFLLASDPFENVDRYLNFIVSADDLTDGYDIHATKNSTSELAVASNTVAEIYPPLILKKSIGIEDSYMQPDTVTTTTSIATDDVANRLPTNKIIGPI